MKELDWLEEKERMLCTAKIEDSEKTHYSDFDYGVQQK